MNGVYLISILNSEVAISPGASTSRTTLKHARKAPATSRKSRCPPVLGCRYFKRLTSRRVDLGNFLPSWKEFSRRRVKQETSKLTRPLCTKVIQKELYLKPTDPVLQGSLFKYLADSVCIIQDALTLLQKPKAAWAGCTQKPFLHSKRWQRTTCPHRLCWGKGHRRCPTNHVTWLCWSLSLSPCRPKDKPGLNSGTWPWLYLSAVNSQGVLRRRSTLGYSTACKVTRDGKQAAAMQGLRICRNGERISNAALSADIFVLWRKNAFRNHSRSHLYIKTLHIKGHLLF